MKIYPITNFIINKSANNKTQSNNYRLQLQPSLATDTVSFSGVRPKDMMTLTPTRILAECRKAVKEAIKIGEGQEAIAYKIENFPSYCIRCDKKLSGPTSQYTLNTNLDKYDRVNHVVAKLDKGTQLMEYVAGIPLKIMPHRDTPDGIQVKKATQGLIANNFPETSFRKIIATIEEAKSKGIDFDRHGENLLVDPVNQEFNCIDFSPRFHDIEYNPISYIYSAIDVDKTDHSYKIFGKLCKAYAQRILEAPLSKLNLESLDLNFYHRGFINDPFCNFKNKAVLDKTTTKLQKLIDAKKDENTTKEYLKYLVDEFKEYVDTYVMDFQKYTSNYSFNFEY